MPDKQAELQIALEEILDCKKAKHGYVFQIKIAHYTPMWVPEQKLSKGAAMSHITGCPLPTRAYVVLARSYSNPPVKKKMKSMSVPLFVILHFAFDVIVTQLETMTCKLTTK